ncbi:hypothetical protein G7Y89_g1468 [Cudoniella acicularis]|uniref:non-specific serine/threonine protein kinase n=1 Tax=Cudoniella acicularis TaxID=354080 RepID=A0A8H4RV79_9HELO|nr:hypothetical protein G7Y89_g1468 [Cudoniella acicularis]
MSKARAATDQIVKLIVGAGQASPSPPVGPALGSKGVKSMDFCKEFNARTAHINPGTPTPVRVTVRPDRTFHFEVRTPTTSYLLLSAAQVEPVKGKLKGKTGNTIVGEISLKHVYEIAKIKQSELRLSDRRGKPESGVFTASASCPFQMKADAVPGFAARKCALAGHSKALSPPYGYSREQASRRPDCLLFSDSENPAIPTLESNKAAEGSSTVRFASVNEEIEPASIDSLESVPQPSDISGNEQEKLKELSKTLHGTHLQERRMSHFAFEPVSLPASRVPSNESSREPSRHNTHTSSGRPSPHPSPGPSSMHSPPITPAATRSRDAVEVAAKGASLQKVETEGDPAAVTPQISPPETSGTSPSTTNIDYSRPGSSGVETRPTSQSGSFSTQAKHHGAFSIGPSTHETIPVSREQSPSRTPAAQTYSRPFTPAGDVNDPYAASKRPPQTKNLDAIDQRFKFTALNSKHRVSPNSSTTCLPRSSRSTLDVNNGEKRHTTVFGGGHKDHLSHLHDDSSATIHTKHGGSMSELKRFLKIGGHHKAKRAVSPAPSNKSGTKTPPHHKTAQQLPFDDNHGLQSKYGKFGKVLGAGAGGSVRLMKRSSDGTTFAVKQFRDRHSYESEKEYAKKVTAEFCVGSTLHHGNIIETLDIVHEKGKWYEVMEYAPYDLFAIVMTGKMSREEISCSFLQILSGVTYLHSMGLAHRDLKLDNVVVNEFGIMKIIDFGSASVFKYPFEGGITLASGIVGSDPYLAPEVYDERKYDPQPADIWSLAIIFCCMSLRRFPWKMPRMTDNSYKLFASPPTPGTDMKRLSDIPAPSKSTNDLDTPARDVEPTSPSASKPPTPKAEVSVNGNLAPEGEKKPEVIKGPWRLLRLLPRESRHIMSRMLEIDPRKRAKMEEVLADPWVAGTNICRQEEGGRVIHAEGHTHTLEPPASPAPAKPVQSLITFTMSTALKSIKSLAPLLDRVLVQRIKAETKTASGIFLPESAVKELNEAKVLAVGPGGLDRDGKRVSCSVQPGDKVLIPQPGNHGQGEVNTLAHAAQHFPKAALQAKIAGGGTGMPTPQVNPLFWGDGKCPSHSHVSMTPNSPNRHQPFTKIHVASIPTPKKEPGEVKEAEEGTEKVVLSTLERLLKEEKERKEKGPERPNIPKPLGARPLPISAAAKKRLSQSRGGIVLASEEDSATIIEEKKIDQDQGKNVKSKSTEKVSKQQQQQIKEQYEQDIRYQHEKRMENEAQLETAQLEIGRLKKTEEKYLLLKLQMEKLKAVAADGFKPVPDVEIIAKLAEMNAKTMKTLVFFLARGASELGPADLNAAVESLIWISPYYKAAAPFDFNNRELRRALLKSIVWRFLQNNLFSRPFVCFGSEAGHLADTLYSAIFSEPRFQPESAKWRSLTAERLISSESREDEDEIQRRLFIRFQGLLHHLGYSISDADLQIRSSPLFKNAIQLGKLFASQRAMYELFDHQGARWWTKELRSDYCRNQDDENKPEGEGEIAFLVVPALVRRGTTMGEDLKQAVFLTKALVHIAQ